METDFNTTQQLNSESVADLRSPLAGNAPQYNRAEVGAIVDALTREGLCDPEYILLFGLLAGATPHSQAAACDLLVVVRDPPQ